MMFDDAETTFAVVVNHQEQYSVWPEFKEIPAGWVAVGPRGTKQECLEYIDRVWTDMRPKSLRDSLDGDKAPADDETGADEVGQVVDQVLDEHDERIDDYADGKPELYGWFVARVFEQAEELDPDVIRHQLDQRLPDHRIPEHYA